MSTPQTPATPVPETKVSAQVTLRAAIKERLSDSHECVKAAIINAEVEAEVAKRTKATTKVLEKLEATQLEIRKTKPTFPGYDDKGVGQGTPMYTKEQADSLKKLKETEAKLNNALERALNEGNFDKVNELAN